jgi:GGDEF domain-containing protein
MSFGIAGLYKNKKIQTATDWISQADTALYKSKKTGRNRTTLFKGK